MIGMKKGLFGKRGGMPGVISGYGGGTFDMDGTQVTPASMPQNQTMQDGANLGTPAGQKGGGFFGQGGGGRAIAGTLGDFLLQQGGMAPVYAPQMQFQQVQAMRQAEAQRARAAELADYRTKLGIQKEFEGPEQPDITTVEDNAGNVFRFDKRTGQQIGEGPMFVDRSPKYYVQGDQAVRINNPFAQGGSAAPQAPVGKLTPIQPTIENTPAPQLGSNGMPTSLTRAQYQAVEQRMGKADTEAWARRNNIRVAN